MRPTGDTTVQRPDLGLIAFERMVEADQRGYIGLQVMPLLPVPDQASDFPIIPNEYLAALPDTNRASGAGYNRDDWEFESDTYSCKEHGLESPVKDDERKKWEGFYKGLQIERTATIRTIDIILRSQEKRVADAVMDAATFSANSITNEWNDATNATPRADIKNGKKTIRENTGLLPDSLILSYNVFEALIECDEVKDYLKYTGTHLLDGFELQKRQMAQYLGIGQILVGNAIYNSAKKGQTFSATDIWPDEYAMLTILSDGGFDLLEPALGRTFLWTEDSPENTVVEMYREEQTRSDIVRVRHNTAEDIIAAGVCYLLDNMWDPT